MKKIFTLIATLIMIFTLSLSAMAASEELYDYNSREYPITYYNSQGEQKNYVELIQEEGGYLYLVVDGTSDVMVHTSTELEWVMGAYGSGGTDIFTTTEGIANVWIYQISGENAYTWQPLYEKQPYSSQSDVATISGLMMMETGQLQWSNEDTYKVQATSGKRYIFVEGDSNFKIPSLAEKVLAMATGEVQESLIPKTVGTMKILVVCGVSLMALLMALVILPKVFRKFL